ncbi:MAG: hypothetical protein NT034_04555 [Candidatus Magasanikbacteria bacterium]|nr:hypothetical protein [Candidatus Magasanikbacteria bacterium]
MDKNTKVLLAIVTVVIVLGGLIWVVFSNNSTGVNSDDTSSSDYLRSIQSIPTSTVSTSTSSTAATGGIRVVGDAEKNTPLYVEMVKKFGGNRFQFSANCTSVQPSSFVLKAGQQFMVDNRDSKAHTFSFGGKKYAVTDYGYAIVTAIKAGTQPLLCDGIQRARVTVEK